jgi:hypothetical protein
LYFYKWYLKNSKNLDKPDGLQDYIFANSMLFRHYVKKESLLDILKTGRLLFENKDIDRRVLHNIHVFPLSRWYSYRVWYSYHNRFKNYDESLFELIEFCKQINDPLPQSDTFLLERIYENLTDNDVAEIEKIELKTKKTRKSKKKKILPQQ